MFNKRITDLEKLKTQVDNIAEALDNLENEDYITCDKCGGRFLKEKAIKGKDEVRVKEYPIFGEPFFRTEKYIHSPYFCIHCKGHKSKK